MERVTRSSAIKVTLNLGVIMPVDASNQFSCLSQEQNREDCEERPFFSLSNSIPTHPRPKG